MPFFKNKLAAVSVFSLMVLSFAIIALMALGSSNLQVGSTPTATATASPVPSETIPPYTPLPTLTPSRTLMPPPTFEPPTATAQPTASPTETATATFQFSMEVPGLHGLESPTPTTTPGCVKRKDWTYNYVVQPNDALERIAQTFNVSTADLAAANCISDANYIVVGQQLRVPSQLSATAIACVPWEVLTPIDNAYNVDGSGQLTFNWRGPRAPRNLIRVIKPDGTIWERTVDLRQNETINLTQELPAAGTYTWYVYPLDENFYQINCHEGGPWTFQKTASPTATPTRVGP